jgi:hypothetical protein
MDAYRRTAAQQSDEERRRNLFLLSRPVISLTTEHICIYSIWCVQISFNVFIQTQLMWLNWVVTVLVFVHRDV